MPIPRQRLDLVRLLAGRRFAERFQGTLFGWAWLLMGPLLTIALLSFVFGSLLDVRWEADRRAPYAMILFSGLIVHFFIAECLSRSPNLIIERAELVHQVPFPLSLLTVISLLDVGAVFLIGLTIFLGITLLLGFGLDSSWMLIPLTVLPLLFYGLALGWGLSSIGVYVRDLNQVSGPLSTGLLLFSPILYPLSTVPETIRPFYYLNPVTAVVENLRTIVFSGAAPSLRSLVLPLLASIVLAMIAYLLFRKLRNGFSDVV